VDREWIVVQRCREFGELLEELPDIRHRRLGDLGFHCPEHRPLQRWSRLEIRSREGARHQHDRSRPDRALGE